MRTVVILILSAIAVMPAARAQQWQLSDSLYASFDYFTTDNLQQLYTVKGAELVKYSPDLKFMFRYSDKQLGSITHVDASYSLRPLLFYRDLNNVVILDNTLTNQRGSRNLQEIGLALTQLACKGVQNRYWFYDFATFSLIKTDDQFKPLVQTGNLEQILQRKINPLVMYERNNWLYLLNGGTEVLVFDLFGTFAKAIPVANTTDFQVADEELIYASSDSLVFYNQRSLTEKKYPLPRANSLKQVRWEDGRLFVGTGHVIYRYKMIHEPE